MLWTLTISFLFYFIFTNLKLVIVTSVIVSPFLKEKVSHISDIFHVDLHILSYIWIESSSQKYVFYDKVSYTIKDFFIVTKKFTY